VLAWRYSIAGQTLGSIAGQALELWDCAPTSGTGRRHEQRVPPVFAHEMRQRVLIMLCPGGARERQGHAAGNSS